MSWFFQVRSGGLLNRQDVKGIKEGRNEYAERVSPHAVDDKTVIFKLVTGHLFPSGGEICRLVVENFPLINDIFKLLLSDHIDKFTPS